MSINCYLKGTSLHELVPSDISLPPHVIARLGHSMTHTSPSSEFAQGLACVRNALRCVFADAHWGTVRCVSLRAPCDLLRSGGKIVDSPVVEDCDLARTRHLFGWMKECTALLVVLSNAPVSHALRALLEKSGYLHTVLEDPSKQLAVVVPGDKFINSMDREKREDWETRHKKEKIDALRKSLIKCSRAQEKRNAVSAFIETSGRFKFFHFYRYDS